MTWQEFPAEDFSHPFSDAGVTTVQDLHLLPQNALGAPAPHLVPSFHSEHQQDDEADGHQEAEDNSYGLMGG